jgi:hypothetical protein
VTVNSSITGPTLAASLNDTVPFTDTLPVLFLAEPVNTIDTGVVSPAVTLKVAEPVKVVASSTDAELNSIV